MTLKPFKYIAADSLSSAEELLRQHGDRAAVLAGGTDLLGTLKDAVHPQYPEYVVSLKRLRALRYIEADELGVRIGATTTLDEIAGHPLIRERFTALAEAAQSVASGQIRNVATIAGNICQEPRCWYYRNPDNTFECLRKGGSRCNALFGENRYHSIFGAAGVDVPPCTEDCPIRTDIPAYMERIRNNDVAGAAQILLDCNPLAAITGRVCPHFCEDECNRVDSDEAVSIREVERFLGDYLLTHASDYYTAPGVTSGKHVGVVGAGPAGLTAAYFLRKAGHDVTVYDQMPEAGGMLTYSIPTYRLPKTVVREQVRVLERMGIRFQLGVRIGDDGYSSSDLQQRHDSLILALGLWKSRTLQVEDAALLNPGLEFLIAVQRGQRPAVGRRVLVIGGGSVAVDVAITALRLGAGAVTMAFLESRGTMPALPEDVEQALSEGVQMLPSYGPMRVLQQDGRLTGIELMRCTSVFDEEGRFAPCFDSDDRTIVEADQILYAIGQAAELSGIEGHGLTQRGLIAAHRQTQATALPGVYAAGDITRGPATVVNAIAEGRRAAETINTALAGPSAERKAAQTPHLLLNTDAFVQRERNEGLELPVNQRTLLDEDRATLLWSGVAQEARRCANCGCVAVNASDLAPALIALDAIIKTTRRTVAAEAFFAATTKKTTVLASDELVEEVRIPTPGPGVRQGYLKFRLRNAIDFPIVSLAYRWEMQAGRFHNPRLVLGAVGPLPVRATKAEALLEGRAPGDDLAHEASSLVVDAVQPLAHNRYKVAVLEGLIRKAASSHFPGR